MDVLLIDMGALGIFLGYVATVYWYAISHDRTRRDVGGPGPETLERAGASPLRRVSWIDPMHGRGRLVHRSGEASAHRN